MMKLGVFLTVCVLLLFLLPVNGSAEESFVIVVISDSWIHSPGDEVELTVHLLYKGELVDGDELEARTPGRTFDPERLDTGTYRLRFTIQDRDLVYDTGSGSGDSEPFEGVVVLLDALYDDLEASERAELNMVFLNVEGRVDNHRPSVGDTVEFTALVTNLSKPYDPEELFISVYQDQDYNEKLELLWVRKDTGVYTASYTILPGDNESHVYHFFARARDGEVTKSSSGLELRLDRYLVWYHSLEDGGRAEGSRDFELYVTDPGGKAVPGALVLFAYVAGPEHEDRYVGSREAVTDAEGRAVFSIPDDDEVEVVDIEGKVLSRFTQHIDRRQWLFREREEEPYESGFSVIGPADFYEEETEVSIDLQAYYDGEPYEGEYVYIYAFGPQGLYYHGNFTVSEGSVSLTITTPEVPEGSWEFFYRIRLEVHAQMPSGHWSDSRWYLPIENPDYMKAKLEFWLDPLEIGGNSSIGVEDGSRSSYYGWATILPEINSNSGEDEEDQGYFLTNPPEWELWTHDQGSSVFPLAMGENGVATNITTPEVWDQYEDFRVSVLLIEYDRYPVPGEMVYGSEVFQEGEGSSGESGGEEENGGFLPGFTGLELLPALCVVLLWQLRKKRS
jgi:hypothetical protein